MNVASKKQQLRETIWKEMERSRIAVFPLPCRGRIPNFKGAEIAAERLRQLEDWKKAKVVFVNPDSPQRKVRENALREEKTLIMASPRLRKGFILINPAHVKEKEHFASTMKGAFKHGVEVNNFPKPNLIVQGSVAVDTHGHRLGKGHGYGDVEIKTLKRRFGVVPVATTVHDMQVVEAVPFEEKDEKVSVIVTPTRVIRVSSCSEMKKICKWYVACPMKRFYEEGKLERKWIEEYCMGDYIHCVRYKLEEAGTPHPDNMLPNGEIMKSLK